MATRPVDVWMWTEAYALLGEADRLQRQFFRLAAVEQTPPAWEPPIDVFEDERELVVVVAMPGVPSDRVEVSNEQHMLVVRGTRSLPIGSSRQRVRRLEIPYGAFERRIALPPGRLEIETPELVQGCLVIRIHKLGGAG
jgi:HSP20 family molecular chaperone IbpA